MEFFDDNYCTPFMNFTKFLAQFARIVSAWSRGSENPNNNERKSC
jgi:hypothetical protein